MSSAKHPPFLTTFRHYALYTLLMIPVRAAYFLFLLRWTHFWAFESPLPENMVLGTPIPVRVFVAISVLTLGLLIPHRFFVTDSRWLQATLKPLAFSDRLLWISSLTTLFFLTPIVALQFVSLPLYLFTVFSSLFYSSLSIIGNTERWQLPPKARHLVFLLIGIVAPLSVLSFVTLLQRHNFYRFTPTLDIVLVVWVGLNALRLVPLWRQFRLTRTRAERHERLRDLTSLTPPISWRKQLHNRLRRFQSRYRWIPLFLLLLSPLPILLAVLLMENEVASTSETKALVLTGGFVLTGFMIFVVSWTVGGIILQLREQRRYLVIPFVVMGRSNDEVRAIANLMTYSLVNELQRVGKLLSWRQSENSTVSVGHDLYPMFVASGHEHNIVEELRNLKSLAIDSGTVRFPLGQFLERFIETSAIVRVQGTLQQRDNGAIEIWIQMTRRDSPSISAEQVIVTGNSTADINEITADTIARELACKLVLQLSEGQPLAADPKSLQHFLAGIEAMIQRKWWLAISHYRTALAKEQTAEAKYGLLHYHLCAAFLFQGDLEKGREHLELAEQSGLLLPELQYMLARIQLYSHWDQLDTDVAVFDDIVRRSKAALSFNTDAPETLHLLGALYYHRGRLRERNRTFAHVHRTTFEGNPLIDPESQGDYQAAEDWFRKAESAYDKNIHRIALSQQDHVISARAINQTVQARMMVTHQIADALRGQRHFALSDLTYRDVIAIYPENLRNLVDRAKNYCLAGKWQTAYVYLTKRILRNKLAQWNADANFYTAWSLIGGLADGVGWKSLEAAFHSLTIVEPPQSYEVVLKEALRYLDFALVQRPRYLARWNQNDWFKALEHAITGCVLRGDYSTIQNIQGGIDLGKVFESKIEPGSEGDRDVILLYQTVLWLILRLSHYQWSQIDSGTAQLQLDVHQGVTSLLTHPTLKFATDIEGFTSNQAAKSSNNTRPLMLDHLIQTVLERANLLEIVEQLASLRELTARFLYRDQEVIPLEKELISLELSEQALKLWALIQGKFGIPLEVAPETSRQFGFTLEERYQIDLVAETALLTLRLLVGGGAYLEANQVAVDALSYLARWRREWGDTYPRSSFLFSSQVFRYQLASIYAWTAHIQYQRLYDKETLFRERLATTPEQLRSGKKGSTHDSLVTIQRHLQDAFTLMRTHPLAMYVQALIRRQQKLYVQAAEELQFLLQTIAPFDPSRFVRKWGPQPKTNAEKQAEQILVEHLDIVGKINGARQFESVVNEASIHALLAEIYEAQNEPDLAVEQSRAALMWQRPNLYSTRQYLALAKRLADLERFDEADSVLDTIRVPGRQSLMPLEVVSHFSEIETMRCVLATRKGNHEQSLEMGQELAQRLNAWDINTFVTQWTEHRTSDTTKPEGRLVAHYHSIKALLNKIFTDEQQIDRLLSALKTHEDHGMAAENETPAHVTQDHSMPDVFDTPSQAPENQGLRLYTLKPSNYVGITGVELKKLIASTYVYLVVMNDRYCDETESAVHDLVWSLIPPLFTLPSISGMTLRQRLNELDSSLLTVIRSKQIKEPIGVFSVIRTKILYRFFEYQLNHFLQIAELSNTFAYNHSEIDIRHRYAFQHARYSILIARFVNFLGDKALDDGRLRAFRANLAQYHDTLGWVYYRAHTSFVGKQRQYLAAMIQHLQHSLTGLEAGIEEPVAENDLLNFPLLFLARDHLERALRYDADRAIFYYHLARTHTTNLEYKWQGLPNKRDLAEVAEAAPTVMMHLRKADRYWTRAKRLDNSNRLHTRLVWLRQRIQEYRDAWNTRQVTQFSGIFEEDADTMRFHEVTDSKNSNLREAK